VPLVISAGVAVSEGRNGATEGAEKKENGAEPLVGGVALTAVGGNGVEELEHEHCGCREKLNEVTSC